MPWPFRLFGRSRRAGPAEAPASPARTPVQRASGRDWQAVPAIARTTGDLALTAESRRFAAGLPGTVGLPRALQPLGHARTLDAPPGLVTMAELAPPTPGPPQAALSERPPAG